MVFITHIRQSNGSRGHEHITDVKWKNPDDGKTGETSVPTMVDWIMNKNGTAKVTDGRNTVEVGVVKTAQPPHLRTHADGKWTDNLLALPRF